MNFARHRYVVEFVKGAKGPKFWQNGGQNKKMFNVEPNFPFGTLKLYKWTKKWLRKQNNAKNVLCQT